MGGLDRDEREPEPREHEDERNRRWERDLGGSDERQLSS
jgi:hypothetical protein